ncbi:MAG: glycosyltransferase family 4 protein [Desulfosoma sp.]
MIYTVSDHFKRLLMEVHSIPASKIRVTPNAIDPERFKIRNCVFSRKALGINHEKVICTTGAFVHWYGLGFLLDSISDLLKTEDLHLLLVGDGPARSEIESKAKAQGLMQHITFTGFVTSEIVPHYLFLADIVVIPDSNAHGSPMKLFESMAMGKPIVAVDDGPIRAVLEHGRDGLLFPPKNQEAFRKELLRVLKDRELGRRLGEAARSKVFARYTWVENPRAVLSDFHHVRA